MAHARDYANKVEGLVLVGWRQAGRYLMIDNDIGTSRLPAAAKARYGLLE